MPATLTRRRKSQQVALPYHVYVVKGDEAAAAFKPGSVLLDIRENGTGSFHRGLSQYRDQLVARLRDLATKLETTIRPNKSLWELVKRHGGRIVPFRRLPKDAQLAMIQYMAYDGEAWNVYKNTLDEEARKCFVTKYGDQRFGYVTIPTQELTAFVFDCMKLSPEGADYDTFDAYHRWYAGQDSDTDHGNSVWPVILCDIPNEGLEDGWHRFHSYVRKGLKEIPCLYYPPGTE